MIIEVNGVKYQQKEKSFKVSKQLFKIFTMADVFGGNLGGFPATPEVTEGVIKEYGLIQKHTSNLSKRQRDQIVFIFESNFIKI